MNRLLIAAVVLMAGCQASRRSGPYEVQPETARNTTQAEQRTREAADFIKSEPERAEALLREALSADLFYGPAHNNLGVLFLRQEKRYEAAQEFEWAKKLLPGQPDPRINLALCLEGAGDVVAALEQYEGALAVAPSSVAALQGAASLVVRAGRQDERLEPWLREIAMRGESLEWREWASAQASRLD